MPVRRMIAAIQSRGSKSQRQFSRLAEAAARASYPAVCRLVGQRTQNMSLAEARGYVRSISMRTTHRELQQLLIGYPRLAESELPSILDRAVDHLVRMILSQRVSHATPQLWQRQRAA